MTVERLRAFGLRIHSDVHVPGGLADAGGDAPEIVVRRGRIGSRYDGAADGPYRLGAAGLSFEAPGVARYAVETASIVVEALPDADDEAVSALLVATALPAMLWLRGRFVVHACAFVPKGWDRAIAITAPSGGGKSTLLHQAALRGAAVVADDVLCVEADAGGAIGSGLAGGYFLGPGDGRAFRAADRSLPTAPIAALVDLAMGEDQPTFERADPQAAVALLMHARHRPRVPRLLGRLAGTLDAAALLARRLPIYRMTTGRDDDPAATAEILVAAIGERQGNDA